MEVLFERRGAVTHFTLTLNPGNKEVQLYVDCAASKVVRKNTIKTTRPPRGMQHNLSALSERLDAASLMADYNSTTTVPDSYGKSRASAFSPRRFSTILAN